MINAIILQKGKLSIYKKKPLIHHTISTLKNSKYINKIILSTDANETIKIVNQKNRLTISPHTPEIHLVPLSPQKPQFQYYSF